MENVHPYNHAVFRVATNVVGRERPPLILFARS